MGFVGFPGQAGRYVSGLCVATLGLCAAGWLALAPVAFGYRSAGRAGTSLHRAAWADWATAAALALVSLVTLACWVVAWRRRLRADGILAAGLTAAGPAGNPRAAATRARRRGRGPHPRSGAGAERTADAAHPAAARASRAGARQPGRPNGPGLTRTIGPEPRRSRTPGPAA